MTENRVLSKEEVLKLGLEFDGDKVCFSGAYGDQLFEFSSEQAQPLTGLVYELYPNGNIQYYSFYEEGVLNGITVEFYDNMQIKSIYKMNKGTVMGELREYFQNGKLKKLSQCKYGKILTFVEYDENGNIVNEKAEITEIDREMILKYDAIEEKNEQ